MSQNISRRQLHHSALAKSQWCANTSPLQTPLGSLLLLPRERTAGLDSLKRNTRWGQEESCFQQLPSAEIPRSMTKVLWHFGTSSLFFCGMCEKLFFHLAHIRNVFLLSWWNKWHSHWCLVASCGFLHPCCSLKRHLNTEKKSLLCSQVFGSPLPPQPCMARQNSAKLWIFSGFFFKSWDAGVGHPQFTDYLPSVERL